jgi:hypothetical protein
MTDQPSTSRFDCPNCGAQYALVRVEAETVEPDVRLACRCCNGPLDGYEHGPKGPYILKYLLLERPRHVGRAKLVDRSDAAVRAGHPQPQTRRQRRHG